MLAAACRAAACHAVTHARFASEVAPASHTTVAVMVSQRQTNNSVIRKATEAQVPAPAAKPDAPHRTSLPPVMIAATPPASGRSDCQQLLSIASRQTCGAAHLLLVYVASPTERSTKIDRNPARCSPARHSTPYESYRLRAVLSHFFGGIV